ncbi:MAG TPA: helix-turn-helix domain-containing protein [Stellaceae bacterium]|nr:helix-turn-helix domain-containing protein [Stellaceae bacterium]
METENKSFNFANNPQRPARLAYTIDETAEALKLGRTSVYNLVREGKLRALKFGRATRIPIEDVRRLAGGAL